MLRSALAAALLASATLAFPAAAQEAPRISVTEAQVLSTIGASGGEDPYWVLTLQHFSTWKYGSNFFFVDLADTPGLDFYEGDPGLYLEFAPVLSLGSLGVLRTPEGSALRDVGVTAQINAGWTQGSEFGPFPINRVFLEGVDLAWAVPGFVTFNTALLARQEVGYDLGGQFTIVYTAPFSIAGADGVVTGFFDLWSRSSDEREEDLYAVLLVQPQVLLNATPNLQVGVELEPSYNYPTKFLSDGWNVAVSPMLRWVF